MPDILAIAAHPDDVEQSCGGTLMRMQELGYTTGVIDLTAGEMGSRGTPEIRLNEAEDAARVMRLAMRENMRFPDARLENVTDLFPEAGEIRERHAAIARFYGNLIGVRYGEPFVVKETMRVDDVVAMPVRSI